MHKTYKVVWPCVATRYFKKKSVARKTYDSAKCPSCNECVRAEKLSSVILAPDAFERSANGTGGYEWSETVLATDGFNS